MPSSLVPLDEAAAWRGADLAARADWRHVLADAQIAELDAAIARTEVRGAPLSELSADDFALPALQPLFEALRAAMEDGPGVALLRGLPVERWGEARTRIALWGLGTGLGWAEPQDGAGNLLHDVRDIGRRFGADDQIRYFQTNQPIEFHNDGADIFALACLRAGRSGGRSRLVSAVAVYREIVRRRPDLAALLLQPFHFDARGQHPRGLRCQVIPVFSVHEGRLSVIKKTHYIVSAQRFDDVPRLTPAQEEALALLDAIPEEPGMALEFDLASGDVLIASNHVTLHGRTAFTDDEAPGQQRHMLRLWLTIPNGRALPAHYADTREFGYSWNRRMRPASVNPCYTDSV